MNTKIRPVVVTAGAVALCALGIVAFAASLAPETVQPPPSDRQALLARGEYLVHQVGLCIDCHSPRGEGGEFVAGRHLTGAPLSFSPAVPMPWAPVAPPIAGMPAGWSEEGLVHFLMTGERPNNLPPPLPPMPPYRLDRPDAEAVAAYLQSLGSPLP